MSPLVEGTRGGAVLPPPVEAPPRRRRRRRAARPERRLGGGAPPPPGRGGGGGGGGGDGDGGGDGRSPGRPAPEDASDLGFALFLMGVGTLFLTFLAVYGVMWRRNPVWPPPGTPEPPEGLWLSTAALGVVSVTMTAATRARRRADTRRLRSWLRWSGVAGAGFLVLQAWLWRELFALGFAADTNAYGALFYSLTGLHALHVVGGLGFLGVVLKRAHRKADPPAPLGAGVRLCAIYWHFMGLLWLLLFGVLYFAR